MQEEVQSRLRGMPARVWSPSCLWRAKEKGVGWRSEEDGECLRSLLRRVAQREGRRWEGSLEVGVECTVRPTCSHCRKMSATVRQWQGSLGNKLEPAAVKIVCRVGEAGVWRDREEGDCWVGRELKGKRTKSLIRTAKVIMRRVVGVPEFGLWCRKVTDDEMAKMQL